MPGNPIARPLAQAYRHRVPKRQAASLEELMASSRLYRMRRIVRFLPAAPRCKVCNVPFAGPGKVFKLAGLGQSRKNPSMCTACFERAPVGGAETEVGVLFADVRGFTALVEASSPEEVRDLLAPFYRTARNVLMRHEAVIDKLVGDEVMGLFIPLLIRDDPIGKMVAAAVDLLAELGDSEPPLPVGAGADFGPAFVGNVGEEDVKDFTALGDVVNTAQRLQAAADPGQVVLSERVYEAVREHFPNAARVELELKGKAGPVAARVIDVSVRRASPEPSRWLIESVVPAGASVTEHEDVIIPGAYKSGTREERAWPQAMCHGRHPAVPRLPINFRSSI